MTRLLSHTSTSSMLNCVARAAVFRTELLLAGAMSSSVRKEYSALQTYKHIS